MHAILIGGGLLFLLSRLLFWDMQLPGGPRTTSQRGDDEIKTTDEFRAEFGPWLPERYYLIFRIAVRYQLAREYEAARRWYDELRRIPLTSGGVIDLADYSEVLQHNLRLLKDK